MHGGEAHGRGRAGRERVAGRAPAAPRPPARRVADGSISLEEAKQRNAAHYERFLGKKMPKNMFF